MRTRTSRCRHGRIGAALAVAAAVAVLLSGCGGSSIGGGLLVEQVDPVDLSDETYTLGGKNSAEHQVLCEMAVAVLISVSAEVENRCGLGDAQTNRDALARGDIDLYWENTGTAWSSFLSQQPIQGSSPQYRALQQLDLAENKIVWLEPTWFNPTDAFAVNQERAQQLGLTSLSNMAEYFRSGRPGALCIESEYQNSDFGLAGLQQKYDFQVPPERLRILPGDGIYQATADGRECLFGQVTGGDLRTAELGLTMLRDDEKYHPPYNAAIAIRQEAYDRNPEIARAFTPVVRRITDDVIAELTRLMSVEGRSAAEVAQSWLRSRGFIVGGE
ncbi:MAG: glycine betaine ABC transporter substrate-binding protein [Pseudonocardiaceae bacterium]